MTKQLTIVYGGQFGSEGKGQIASFLRQRGKADFGVRVGGPNAGHTFYYPTGKSQVVQSIPVPAMMGGIGVIGPAGFVLLDILAKELIDGHRHLGSPVKLFIDENAVIITKEHMEAENKLAKRISSTAEGVGAASADKIWRKPAITVGANAEAMAHKLARMAGESALSVQVEPNTAHRVNNALLEGHSVLIEGTQGFGLSLHTGGFYPFCTSRECTPEALLAQTGVGQGNAKGGIERIMVIRTYPIRVGGPSGELPNEVTWGQLKEDTGGYVRKPEITTVTKKARRIAEIDLDLLQRAVLQTTPDSIALSFLDYKFPEIAGVIDPKAMEKEQWDYIAMIEEVTGVPVKFVSTGPGATMALRVTT